MNRTHENGSHGAEVEEEPLEQIASGPPSNANGNTPYVPQKDKVKPSLKDNSRLLVIGAGMVLVLLLLAFNGISRPSVPPTKNTTAIGKQQQSQSPVSTCHNTLQSIFNSAQLCPVLSVG